MNAYCPECETDLDPGTGICPACRWDPLLAPGQITRRNVKPPEMSLTERYRGTPYGLSLQSEAVGDPASMSSGVSRGRIFVIVGLVASVALYGVVFFSMSA